MKKTAWLLALVELPNLAILLPVFMGFIKLGRHNNANNLDTDEATILGDNHPYTLIDKERALR